MVTKLRKLLRVLELDQQKFKSIFINLSQAYDKIDSGLFELIHKAFHIAFRQKQNIKINSNNLILYHFYQINSFQICV